MPDPTLPPPVLEYRGAPPRVRPWSLRDALRPAFATVVAALGVVSGLFGLLMLFYGLTGVVYVATRSVRRDLPGDVFEAVMFLTIGLSCLLVAVRWCKAVRRARSK